MSNIKNATSIIDYSDWKTSDVETFINSDAHQCFTNYFASKSVDSERWFIYSVEEDDLGLPDDIGCIMTSQKWRKLFIHPNHHNMHIVKKFYFNMVDTLSKRLEVIVKRTKVQHFELTINMMF